ncbi:D-glycero-beta-D-manno-heptose 1,7-bisphosphate 7-phosphatase [Endozoicomonas sp. SCSIO W0465]|uniref:D-glycero-beta-D-manno-heptose 1,7-bisphosphate 7-phosphatase n=1 Tax=Endozoicomonas sp. SCSIO W0465 TaxID=2918516 RepID=UPI002075DEE4|nr:D-glycero-beta-D-manno-heptose 1,7-bisphosphate 7-phosphatase [Endozoicomonas sp. SCSIO W0465]USE36678.1 D-glycero-beta-D-manno-heptose 1,7-bisphosphate 7-phosphatase [Endozoicomonas sp. SCSIO W0465]
MTKLVILDRDGVINEDSDHYIRSAEEWLPIVGSIEAIARLSSEGFSVVVATNQSGLARAYFTLKALDAMHDKLTRLVKARGGQIDGIYFCPHGPDDHCQCRKPKTGLIDQIFTDYDAIPAETWVVGDSLRDLQAGVACGCKVALVLTGKGLKTQAKLIEHPEVLAGNRDVPVYNNLNSFVEELLSEGF